MLVGVVADVHKVLESRMYMMFLFTESSAGMISSGPPELFGAVRSQKTDPYSIRENVQHGPAVRENLDLALAGSSQSVVIARLSFCSRGRLFV